MFINCSHRFRSHRQNSLNIVKLTHIGRYSTYMTCVEHCYRILYNNTITHRIRFVALFCAALLSSEKKVSEHNNNSKEEKIHTVKLHNTIWMQFRYLFSMALFTIHFSISFLFPFPLSRLADALYMQYRCCLEIYIHLVVQNWCCAVKHKIVLVFGLSVLFIVYFDTSLCVGKKTHCECYLHPKICLKS